MSEGAVGAILTAVALGVRLVDTGASLVVAQVVASLSVPCCPVQERTPERERERDRLGGGGGRRREK